MTRDAGRLLHDRVRQLIAIWTGDMHVDVEYCAGVSDRGRDVVAVADERDRPPSKRTPAFLQCQEIGDGLTGMLLVGQRVDHVELLRRRRELLERFLGKRPNDDSVDPAFEIPRDVLHRFAAAQRDVRLKRHDVAAELARGDFERGPRAKRRLLEQQRDVPALERVCSRRLAPQRPLGLQTRRQLETALEVSGVEVKDGQEVFSCAGRWHVYVL